MRDETLIYFTTYLAPAFGTGSLVLVSVHQVLVSPTLPGSRHHSVHSLASLGIGGACPASNGCVQIRPPLLKVQSHHRQGWLAWRVGMIEGGRARSKRAEARGSGRFLDARPSGLYAPERATTKFFLGFYYPNYKMSTITFIIILERLHIKPIEITSITLSCSVLILILNSITMLESR